MKIIHAFLWLCLALLAPNVYSQKQLVVLKNETVLLRLYPGDEIIFKLKGGKSKKVTYVNNLSDTALVTHRDTVPYHTIERVYFRQQKFYNKIGTALVILGGGLFMIDQFNLVVVNGQSASLDSWVSSVTLTALVVGIPAMLLKKKSQKLNHRHRLMMVTKGSAFYLPDTRGYISPYMEN